MNCFPYVFVNYRTPFSQILKFCDWFRLFGFPCRGISCSSSLPMSSLFLAQLDVECWDQCLCQPERENQLRADHQQLWCESFKERSEAFILPHASNDLESTFGALEVLVLNSGLDNVQWCRYNERSSGTSDRCDEILEPSGFIVIVQLEKISLGES